MIDSAVSNDVYPIAGTDRSRHSVLSALLAVVVAALALMAMAGPAQAHGGGGQIEVGDPESIGDLQIVFPIRITFDNDGHPADEVEGLTVSGKGPDGAVLDPTEAFVPGDAPGVYQATVTLPVEGQWELTIEAVEPAAHATITAIVDGSTVTEPESPTPGDAPDAGGDTAGSGAPTDEADNASDGSASDGNASDGDAADDLDGAVTAPLTREEGDDDGFPVVPVVIAVVLAGVAAVVGFRLATR